MSNDQDNDNEYKGGKGPRTRRGGSDDGSGSPATVQQTEYESRAPVTVQQELDTDLPPEYDPMEVGEGSTVTLADDDGNEVTGTVAEVGHNALRVDDGNNEINIAKEDVNTYNITEVTDRTTDGIRTIDLAAKDLEEDRQDRALSLFNPENIDNEIRDGTADTHIAPLLAEHGPVQAFGQQHRIDDTFGAMPSLSHDTIRDRTPLEDEDDIEGGRSSSHMSIATATVDGKDTRVFITDYSDYGFNSSPENAAAEMRGWAMQRYLGLRTTPHRYVGHEDDIVKKGADGYTVGDAPDHVTSQLDKDTVKDYLAGQLLIGNWDAKPDNVIVNDDGEMTWVDNDFATGSLEMWDKKPGRHSTRNRIHTFADAADVDLSPEEVYEEATEKANSLTHGQVEDLQRIETTINRAFDIRPDERGYTPVARNLEWLRRRGYED